MNEKRTITAEIKFQRHQIAHWEQIAEQLDSWGGWGGYYHQRLEIYQYLIPPGLRVLEVGCA